MAVPVHFVFLTIDGIPGLAGYLLAVPPEDANALKAMFPRVVEAHMIHPDENLAKILRPGFSDTNFAAAIGAADKLVIPPKG